MVDASKALVLVAGYAAFMWWRLQMLKTAVRKGRSMGPAWLRRFAASFMTRTANLNGVRLASEGGEGLHAKVPGHFIYVWHPHGFVSYVPSHIMGSKAIAGQPHGTEWFGTCIPLIFNIPFLGEIFQLTNARPVDQKTCESILRNGKGIAIQPGGVKEQAASQHDQEQAFFSFKARVHSHGNKVWSATDSSILLWREPAVQASQWHGVAYKSHKTHHWNDSSHRHCKSRAAHGRLAATFN